MAHADSDSGLRGAVGAAAEPDAERGGHAARRGAGDADARRQAAAVAGGAGGCGPQLPAARGATRPRRLSRAAPGVPARSLSGHELASPASAGAVPPARASDPGRRRRSGSAGTPCPGGSPPPLAPAREIDPPSRPITAGHGPEPPLHGPVAAKEGRGGRGAGLDVELEVEDVAVLPRARPGRPRPPLRPPCSPPYTTHTSRRGARLEGATRATAGARSAAGPMEGSREEARAWGNKG